jgi:Heterokaryon incompatibility protein (HET)
MEASTYVYTPIPPSSDVSFQAEDLSDWIRLLKLYPDLPGTVLRGELVLNDMPYEALSYYWGHQQESDRSQIELWDGTSWNALSVTANLKAALGRLRYTDGEICL